MRCAPRLLACAASTVSTVLAAALAAACGGTTPTMPIPMTGALAIGGGAEDGAPGFVDFTDGQDVTMVAGAQGGFHVFVNVRVSAGDMNPTNTLYIDRKARRDATHDLVSQTKQRAMFEPSPAAGYYDTAQSMRLFLCPTPIGVPVKDEVLVIHVMALEEETDTTPKAEGEIKIRARCPADQQAFCERICAG